MRRPVVLRESSVVLGSLASGALSPTEARRLGQACHPRGLEFGAYHSSSGGGLYPFPVPGSCKGVGGNGSPEIATDVVS
jgi:hypothetical protein